MSKVKEAKSVPKPPDGGYGWVICATCFFCAAVVDGIPTGFGIVLEPIATELQASRSTVAMVASLLLGLTEGVGPLACIMINKLGLRVTSLTGSLIGCTAYLVASYASSVWMLILSIGVMGGNNDLKTFSKAGSF